jgi:hypothetical protein
MAYTQAEITTAIEKIVQTSMRRDYGALGNRRMDRTFSDIQDAAAGVFILFGNAPFYVVLLAGNRLRKAIETEQALISDFIETVEDTDRRVTVITSLSPLANASSALTNLASAAGSRTSDFVDIEDVPAFKRFENNTQRFLDESSKNVVQGGEIKQTPAEARSNLAGLFRDLKAQHEDVIRRAGLLEVAIDDFNSLSLAKTLSENVIANSRDVIDTSLAELEGLSEKDRLAIVRRVTLDILAARASVRGFGNITGPTTFLNIDGIGNVFADTLHPATPAFIQSDILDPYPVLNTQADIDITLDGDTVPTTLIQLTGSYVARLEATLPEPFDIDSSATPPSHEFLLQIDNYPNAGIAISVPITLTDDPTKPIFDLVKEINDDIDSIGGGILPIKAEPYANPQKFEGAVDITLGGGFTAELIPVNTSIDWLALDIRVDDKIILRDAASPDDESIYQVKALVSAPPTSTLEVDVVDGTVTAQPGVNIVIGTEFLVLRIRTTDETDVAPKPDYRLTALEDRMAIVTALSTATPQTEVEQAEALAHIGLVPNMVFRSQQTPAPALVDAYNLSTQAAVLGEVRTSAEAVFVPQYYSGRGRTDSFDPLKLIASIFQGVGDLTSVGTIATFAVSGAAAAGASIGDVVVLRSHPLADEVNAFATITSVGDSSVVADFAPTVLTPAPDVDIEVGPDLSAIGFDSTAVVSGGSSNDGTYGLIGGPDIPLGPIPIELSTKQQVPIPAGPGFLPIVFELEVGRYAVRFNSLDTTLATSIEIDDKPPTSIAPRFFSTLPATDVGETKYFQLPEFPKNLEEEDVLERHVTVVATPDTTHEIVGLESANLLIELEPELPTDTASITLDKDQPVPFARIRKKRLNSFFTMRDSLTGWAALAQNQELFFRNFARKLNPLAIDSNPTIVEVNDARLDLQGLNNVLIQLDGFLAAYTADEVTQVDSLLNGFTQKGADRASNIILEAQFSVFFGLDQDELSYAGTVQKAVREVTREDLPIRKDRLVNNNRADGIIAEYEEVDYEYNQSDIDTTPELDIPIGGDIPHPGRSY